MAPMFSAQRASEATEVRGHSVVWGRSRITSMHALKLSIGRARRCKRTVLMRQI